MWTPVTPRQHSGAQLRYGSDHSGKRSASATVAQEGCLEQLLNVKIQRWPRERREPRNNPSLNHCFCEWKSKHRTPVNAFYPPGRVAALGTFSRRHRLSPVGIHDRASSPPDASAPDSPATRGSAKFPTVCYHGLARLLRETVAAGMDEQVTRSRRRRMLRRGIALLLICGKVARESPPKADRENHR
jgi:hypothetical protein